MQDKTTPHDPAAAYASPTGTTPPKRKRNLFVTGAVLVLIVGGVGGAIWLAHRPPATGPGGAPGGPGGPGRGGPGRRPSTTVGIATAAQADVPIVIDGLGTVTSAATVTVTPQVSGVITEIDYKEGQTVKKGQTLAIIDPRPLQMALNNAQGQLARDQAQLVNAKTQLGRDQTLLTQDSIARQDVDTQDALVRQLEGTVVADQANVGSAQLNLGFSRVIAPVAGMVGLRPVDLGNYITAGTATGVAVITQVTPIDVEFTIPQVDLPRVQTNAARCALGVTALDQSKTITLDQGVFSTLDNRIDTTTGTVKAKARFENAKGTLFPNQFVNVRLNLDTLHNAVVVPVTAVRTGPQGDFVWVLQPDKTVKQRLVTRGPATVDSTSITQGLDVGERVITEGGDRLTDGARVQLPGDRPIPPGGRRGGRGGRGRRGGAAGAAAGGAAAGGAAAGGASPAGAGQTADAGGAAGDQTPGQGRRGFGHHGAGGGADASGQGGAGQDQGAGGGMGRHGGGQFAQGGAGGRGGPGGHGGRGGRGGMGGAHGQAASGCYTPAAGGGAHGGKPGQGPGPGGRGGHQHGGGDNAVQGGQPPAQGQGRGGRKDRGQGGVDGAQDATPPNGQQRRHRPTDQNGQPTGGGQGGGQSNGG